MAKITTPRNGLNITARPAIADYALLVDSVLEIASDLIDCNGDTIDQAVRAAVRQINDEYQVYVYADAIAAVKYRLSLN